jgi:hypothetical protein
MKGKARRAFATPECAGCRPTHSFVFLIVSDVQLVSFLLPFPS